MNRRTFLGVGGIGLTAIAGCLSQANPDDQVQDDPSGESTDDPNHDATPTNKTERVSSDETTNITLGKGMLSEDGARTPYRIIISNSTNEMWTSTFVVRDPDKSVHLDKTYELEPGSRVAILLTDPLRYTTEVAIPESGSSTTIDVDLEQYDCNSSSANITILSDGELESNTISTMMACQNLQTERVSADDDLSVSLGDGSLTDETDRKPHDVMMSNLTDNAVTSRLILMRDEQILLDGLYTLEPEAKVTVTLTKLGQYQAISSVPLKDNSKTVVIKPDQFDCNNSSTNATIQSGGSLDIKSVSTRMACQLG